MEDCSLRTSSQQAQQGPACSTKINNSAVSFSVPCASVESYGSNLSYRNLIPLCRQSLIEPVMKKLLSYNLFISLGGLNTGLGGGLFNQQQQGLGSGLFNQQQQQAGNPGGGLFNQSGTTGGGIGGGLGGGLFNQQQQQQGITGGLGLFNNNATVANTGGLGATGIGGLFNNQNTLGTGLGQQATGGGLFNTSKPNALGGGLNLGLGGGLGSNLGGGLNLGNKTGGV